MGFLFCRLGAAARRAHCTAARRAPDSPARPQMRPWSNHEDSSPTSSRGPSRSGLARASSFVSIKPPTAIADKTRQDRIRDWIDRPPSLDNVGAQYAKMRVLPMTKCKPLSHSFNHTPPYSRAATAATRSLTATWDRRNHRALRYKCDDQTAIKRLLDSRRPLTCDKTVPVVRPAYKRPRSNLTSSKHLWGDFHNLAASNMGGLRAKLDEALKQQREDVYSVNDELSELQHDIELALRRQSTVPEMSRGALESGHSHSSRGKRRFNARKAEMERSLRGVHPETIGFGDTATGAALRDISRDFSVETDEANESTLFAFSKRADDRNADQEVGFWETS